MKLITPPKLFCDDCDTVAEYTVESRDSTYYLCLKHRLELVTLLTAGPPVQGDDAEHRASKRSEG